MLAAPVAVRDVCEGCAGAVDGGKNVILGSGRRAETLGEGSSSAPNYASGTDPNPSVSSGESEPPLLSTSAGTQLPWNPGGEAKLGSFPPLNLKEVKLPSGMIYSEILPPEVKPLPLHPGPEGQQLNQPASTSKAKSVTWSPSKEVKLSSGIIYSEMLPPVTKPPPKMTTQQLPSLPEHQSENILSKLAGKLKFKFWRRISGTASSVVTEGQRDLQGTVDA